MYHSFLIHLSADGHLGCFHVLAIINSAVMNILILNAIIGRRQWHPTPVLLPGKPLDGGAWKAAVHGVTEGQTRLSNFIFTFHFHALEKEMAIHSSTLAWRIPGMGDPRVYGVAQSRTWLKWLSSSMEPQFFRRKSALWPDVSNCRGLVLNLPVG